MEILNEETKGWLKEDLIPKLTSFFKKSECDVEYKISVPENSKFMSTLFILDLQFTDALGKVEKTISTIVKRPSSDEYKNECMNFEAFFYNEILFYKKCAKRYGNCPELLYVSENTQDKSTIVIENLNTKGYLLNSDKVNVSNKYMLSVVRVLARFHATGYAWKETKPSEFFQIVNRIKSLKEMHTNKTPELYRSGTPRVLKYLRKKKYDETFCAKLESYLTDCYSNVIIGLTKPVEPLATLCHGDFTVNNIFYKKEKEITKFKLIDFSMITYGSPFIDLSIILLLSGTREQRTDKFPEIFGTYCDELLRCLKDYKVENLEVFTKESLMEDYKRHALFGYVVACFYRPVLMGCFETNHGHFENVPLEDRGSLGGDEVTKMLVDMLMDLEKVGCLNHIMNV